MLGCSVYNAICLLLGYILCPLATLGLLGLIAPTLPDGYRLFFAYFLAVVAMAIVLCNVYLVFRRALIEQSASYSPIVAAIAGAGSVGMIAGWIAWFPALIFLVLVEVLLVTIVTGVGHSIRARA
ncbi:MAG: hypothetical protein U0939_23535 [Pirellulales bacterium]